MAKTLNRHGVIEPPTSRVKTTASIQCFCLMVVFISYLRVHLMLASFMSLTLIFKRFDAILYEKRDCRAFYGITMATSTDRFIHSKCHLFANIKRFCFKGCEIDLYGNTILLHRESTKKERK